jgi:hypothetical protein
MVNVLRLNTVMIILVISSLVKMIIVMLSVVLNALILSVALVNAFKLQTDRCMVVILNVVI